MSESVVIEAIGLADELNRPLDVGLIVGPNDTFDLTN
jgi:hypothetical protein